jgi:hypothetical protein
LPLVHEPPFSWSGRHVPPWQKWLAKQPASFVQLVPQVEPLHW